MLSYILDVPSSSSHPGLYADAQRWKMGCGHLEHFCSSQRLLLHEQTKPLCHHIFRKCATGLRGGLACG